MLKHSLPQIPTVDQIKQAGEAFGQMLIDNTAAVERRVIAEYGRCLLANMPPSDGLTLRFFRELADLAPRMPGYSVQVARMSLYQTSISNLQNAIVIYVVHKSQSENLKTDIQNSKVVS